MTGIEWVGTFAGTFTTIAFVPQVAKAWISQTTRDISLWTFLLFSSGVSLWLIYGVLLRAVPIVIANGITLLLSVSILLLKIRDSIRQRRLHRSQDI